MWMVFSQLAVWVSVFATIGADCFIEVGRAWENEKVGACCAVRIFNISVFKGKLETCTLYFWNLVFMPFGAVVVVTISFR